LGSAQQFDNFNVAVCPKQSGPVAGWPQRRLWPTDPFSSLLAMGEYLSEQQDGKQTVSDDAGGIELTIANHVRNLTELHRYGLLSDKEFDSRRAEAVRRR
jgi:hypothetical protein